MGRVMIDAGYGIAIDGSGNVYVTGVSNATWNGPAGQSPLHAHSGGYDIFVLKLDSSGAYQWHTFYGSRRILITAMALPQTAAATSMSRDTAMQPGTARTDRAPSMLTAEDGDIFVLKLDSSGAYQWHTFYRVKYLLGYG